MLDADNDPLPTGVAELRAIAQRYRDLVESSPDLVVRVDLQGHLTFVNGTAARIYGVPSAECIGMSAFDFMHPEDRAGSLSAFQHWMTECVPRRTLENRHISRTGVSHEIEWSIAEVRDADGVLTGFCCFGRDVTHVRDQQRLLRDMQAIAHVGSWEVGLQAQSLGWSDETFRIYGLSPGTSAPQTLEGFLDLLHPDDAPRMRQWIDTCIAGAQPEGIEFRTRPIDGASRWLLGRARLDTNAHGEPYRLLGTVQDISATKLAAARLRRSESFNLAVLDSLTEQIAVIDRKGVIVAVNRSWSQFAIENGAPSLVETSVGTNYLEFCVNAQEHPHGDEAPQALAGIRSVLSGELPSFQLDYPCHSPSEQRWFRLVVAPLLVPEGGAVISHENITQRKLAEERKLALEAQLHHAQKMEAVGMLAGGIAHDFNNVLTIIIATAQLALLDMAAGDALHAELSEIELSARQAAALTRGLLAFSRRQIVAPVVLDLRDTTIGMEPMLRRLIRENLELLVITPPQLGRVRADPGQVEQIVMNLVINARDAIVGSGTVAVSLEDADVDAAFAAQHAGLVPGRYVLLTVSDTGAGMTREVQERIFEPFFTTKLAGRGTGLGLATVYGIVQQSGGAITVRSALGHGSSFGIYLPQVESPLSTKPGARHRPLPRGTETVLVVEDNELLLGIARRVLQLVGYTVLTAGNGIMALQLLRDYQGPLHLVLTDVVMPQLGGVEFAARLAEDHPGVRLLFTSGHSSDPQLRMDMFYGHRAFLAKPYSVEDLARKVREVLDSGRRPPLSPREA
jgi:two-component system, cell cycle sensor histidine kinase and response regulator CckA